jgi:hypothetical protein
MSHDSAVSYKLWRLKMAEWWDNLKEEIYWPIAQIEKWWGLEENQTATWLIVGTTAILALFVYGGLFFGGRRVINALNEDVTITVNEQCVNAKGLLVVNAPSSCFAPKPTPPAPRYTPAQEQPQTIRNNDATISSPNDVAYNPPCVKDGLSGCTDKVYGKRLLTGVIDTVTFNSDERQEADGHLQPDYTEITFVTSDQEDTRKEKFCGNVLDLYTPGRKLKMVLNESKQADYNGCYTTDVVVLTFGGDKYVSRRRK